MGVAPANFSHYDTSVEGFRCFDGNGAGTVNDEYCDCADGSDEPGTSACSHTRGAQFWCANEGYLAQRLPTAKVNDGVCDCCDGSDERVAAAGTAGAGAAGEPPCTNTCAAMGARHRAGAADLYRLALRGRQLRARLVLSAAAQVSDWRRQAEEAAATTTELQMLLPKLEYFQQQEVETETAQRLTHARAQLLHGQARAAFLLAARDEEEEAAKLRPPERPDRSPQGAGGVLLLSSPVNLTAGGAITLQRFMQRQLERRGKRKPKAKLSRREERRQGLIRSIINAQSDELRDAALERLLQAVGLLLSPLRAAWECAALAGRALASAAAWLHHGVTWLLPVAKVGELGEWLLRAAGLRDVNATVTAGGAARAAATSEEDEGSEAELAEGEGWVARAWQLWRTARRVLRGPKAWLLRQSPEASWAVQIMWDAFPSYYAWYFPALNASVTRPEARALARLLTLGATELTAAQGRAAEVTAQLARDDGPGRAFLPLRGRCFHLSAHGYAYKVCPFDRISQDGTSLGTWERWGDREAPGAGSGASAGADVFAAQWFPRGATCYNGLVRNVALRFECGTEDAVLDVDEPSPCVYDVRMVTPAACTGQFFSEAQARAQLWGVAMEVEEQTDSVASGVCEAGEGEEACAAAAIAPGASQPAPPETPPPAA